MGVYQRRRGQPINPLLQAAELNMIMKNKGFTIVELLIATSVFSILLLLAPDGFLQIGRLFYKGVNISQPSSDAKQLVSSIKNDIAFSAPSTTSLAVTLKPMTVGSVTIDRRYFCVGQNRYSYTINRELDTNAESYEMRTQPIDATGWNNFGVLRDQVSSNSCPNPFDSSATGLKAASATELLGNKMR